MGKLTPSQFIPAGAIDDAYDALTADYELLQAEVGAWKQLANTYEQRCDQLAKQLKEAEEGGHTRDDVRVLCKTNVALAADAATLRSVVLDLLKQVEAHAEQHGEADFETSRAHAVLAGRKE